MKIKLSNVRLAFPALFEAKAVNAGDKLKFSAALLIAPSNKQVTAINEAIELAKRFGTTDSRRFVNGVLDRIAKHHAASKASDVL